ncbi:MAG: beta-ketoacyl-[acyl-carrier-protein] synthase family protein [Brumimicrobium sp.]|nr:beta-ketoacyl-[acyl-carrier-protein] synthase family protein [Brumimicrobium sp.]
MENRVVITGMGIWSCLGNNLEEVKQSLFEGKSGIVFEQIRKDYGYQSALTGKLDKPELKDLLSRRQRISMGEESEYAYMATIEALKNAKIDQDYIDQNEVGIIYGNDSVAQSTYEAIDIMLKRKDTALIGSGAIFKSMNSTVTMNLSTIFRLRGINLTASAACASGSHSIGLAYLMIKNGLQDVVIAGGAQEVNFYGMCSFDALGVFAKEEDTPTMALKPFDANRSGLVPSGGAATLVIESLESAKRRGAPIIAEVLGYGFSSNGGHISTPNTVGPATAMQRALKQSGLSAEEIKYINAHATSTPVGDANEASAIFDVFGDKPYVSSTKSMTGHECWMAGASEIIYSTLMMQNNFMAPNINFEKGDDVTSKINVIPKRVDEKFDVYLSNSFGFGGTNSALVIKKYD